MHNRLGNVLKKKNGKKKEKKRKRTRVQQHTNTQVMKLCWNVYSETVIDNIYTIKLYDKLQNCTLLIID